MSKLVLVALLAILGGPWGRGEELPILEEVPTLEIFEEQRKRGKRLFVAIRSPSIEGVAVDLWCYEDEFGLPSTIEETDGKILLEHEYEDFRLRTLFEPEPGGVRVTATLKGPGDDWSPRIRTLNVCMTYQRSPVFSNREDKFDESYLDDYVGRSFVFLEEGLRYLVDTVRVPSVDGRDNPYSRRGSAPRPWVQEYVPAWRSRADRVDTFYGKRPLSTDRPVYPIMGVVSRDQRFLSAFAWPDTGHLGQLFISCVHPNGLLANNCSSQPEGCVTRGKIYFMENDPERLLQQFKQDFPDWNRPPDVD